MAIFPFLASLPLQGWFYPQNGVPGVPVVVLPDIVDTSKEAYLSFPNTALAMVFF